MKIKILLAALVGVLALAACAPAAVQETVVDASQESPAPAVEEAALAEQSEPAVEVGTSAVSFSGDIWPVIEQYALSAHGGKGGVFLESYEDIMNYVVPGDPENSRLYKALTGDGEKQMPPSGRLPDPIIQLFYDWIAQGAPNN